MKGNNMQHSVSQDQQDLKAAMDEFVTQWGALGSTWGINRTMAQIHALLMVSTHPLTTDQVMEELQISRGNAHTNLKTLVDWGLVRGVAKKGERKELFEAEKDVWKIICIITRERRRREIEPALELLKKCAENTRKLKQTEAVVFHNQVRELAEYAELANAVMKKVAESEQKRIFPWIMRFLK
jgi:DNA-binding transcriptional regulator GbsR (MarR family)